MSEKSMKNPFLEQSVVDHATEQGWLSYSWNSKNNHKRLFFRRSRVLVVVFKAPDEKIGKDQAIELASLQHQNIPTHVIDTLDAGLQLFS